ncbi:hypothetical protein [Bacillus sp. MRMR6]|uniref:hypothetical protein n=1 Tax=Bacillus sp. MRMR6 TaxID=1928617 RepID=UPI001588F397|nr:hypothetical protein [Bacillus sp. MRMR6]
MTQEARALEGVCGIVENGIIPGYVSYETGQVAVGDSFAWYLRRRHLTERMCRYDY